MDPIITDLDAFFAFPAMRLLDGIDLVEMRAASVRHYGISLFRVTKTRNALVDEMPL